MEIEKITHKDKTLALFFPKDISADGSIKFFTPPNFPLQIGLIEHKNGKHIPAHIHKDLHYDVNTTQEYLYVEKGEGIKIQIFSSDWKPIKEIIMSAGDSILFVGGGHEIDIPEGCRLFEVKQGPYPGDEAAKYFRDK